MRLMVGSRAVRVVTVVTSVAAVTVVASMAVMASMAVVAAVVTAVVSTVVSWIARQQIGGGRCHQDRDYQQLKQGDDDLSVDDGN